MKKVAKFISHLTLNTLAFYAISGVVIAGLLASIYMIFGIRMWSTHIPYDLIPMSIAMGFVSAFKRAYGGDET